MKAHASKQINKRLPAKTYENLNELDSENLKKASKELERL